MINDYPIFLKAQGSEQIGHKCKTIELCLIQLYNVIKMLWRQTCKYTTLVRVIFPAHRLKNTVLGTEEYQGQRDLKHHRMSAQVCHASIKKANPRTLTMFYTCCAETWKLRTSGFQGNSWKHDMYQEWSISHSDVHKAESVSSPLQNKANHYWTEGVRPDSGWMLSSLGPPLGPLRICHLVQYPQVAARTGQPGRVQLLPLKSL